MNILVPQQLPSTSTEKRIQTFFISIQSFSCKLSLNGSIHILLSVCHNYVYSLLANEENLLNDQLLFHFVIIAVILKTVLCSLRKRPFCRTTTGLPKKQCPRKERRNSILMTCHYTYLGSASEWYYRGRGGGNLLRPIKTTSQMGVVTFYIMEFLPSFFRRHFMRIQVVALQNVQLQLDLSDHYNVSGKMPTYPSPKPTLTLISHLGQNVGVWKGQVGSFPETYNDWIFPSGVQHTHHQPPTVLI